MKSPSQFLIQRLLYSEDGGLKLPAIGKSGEEDSHYESKIFLIPLESGRHYVVKESRDLPIENNRLVRRTCAPFGPRSLIVFHLRGKAPSGADLKELLGHFLEENESVVQLHGVKNLRPERRIESFSLEQVWPDPGTETITLKLMG